MCYGGHQFGNWAGQLGDGRAINFGEIVNQKEKWSLQLKNPDHTLFKNGRRTCCSPFFHQNSYAVNGCISRCANYTSTVDCNNGRRGFEDMFYDGNPQFEKGAIVARLSESFIRFGNFELLAARGELETLETSYLLHKRGS